MKDKEIEIVKFAKEIQKLIGKDTIVEITNNLIIFTSIKKRLKLKTTERRYQEKWT